MSVVKVLSGHVSPETAYVVEDYPYGFRLRCKIRYWIEYKAKKGFRFVSQTTNPKKAGEVWNAPKASTYCRFGAALFLNEEGHVEWRGLSEYSGAEEAKAFAETFGEGVPEAGKEVLARWVKAKVAYEANRKEGDHPNVGAAEGIKAFAEPLS